jgi:predicted ATPase
MTPQALLKSVTIQGYQPFGDFTARLGPLEVLVGANGSGKSSLFEFLKFLRDGVRSDIPSEIVPDSIGQRIIHISAARRAGIY